MLADSLPSREVCAGYTVCISMRQMTEGTGGTHKGQDKKEIPEATTFLFPQPQPIREAEEGKGGEERDMVL